MSTPPAPDQEQRARQLRQALLASWLLTVVICAVLVVLDVVPLVIVAAFFAMDTLVLFFVARTARTRGQPRGPSGLT
jgi:Flp pilus assembly protein TadB